MFRMIAGELTLGPASRVYTIRFQACIRNTTHAYLQHGSSGNGTEAVPVSERWHSDTLDT